MKKHIIVAIAALLIIAGVVLIFKPAPTNVELERSAGTTNLDSLNLGANATGQGITTSVASGVCSTASTTLFAVNPFYGIGTSTVRMGEIYGTQGATTTDIVVGTSTTVYSGADSTNLYAATLKTNYMALVGVATSTQFFASSGITKYTGYTASTTSSLGVTYVRETAVIVGPAEYLIGFSTSTWAGQGNGGVGSGLRPIPSSCTYNFEFKR